MTTRGCPGALFSISLKRYADFDLQAQFWPSSRLDRKNLKWLPVFSFSSSFRISKNISEIPTRSRDIAENVKNRRAAKIEFSILRFWRFWTNFFRWMGLFAHETRGKSEKNHFFEVLGQKRQILTKKIFSIFFSTLTLILTPLVTSYVNFDLNFFCCPRSYLSNGVGLV